MKNTKLYAYTVLIALPIIGILYYVLNPPQCPANYTQAQVDSSNCIVGANIGGLPVFIVLAAVVVLAVFLIMKKVTSKKTSK